MMISRYHSIPRFALPFHADDFLAGLNAVWRPLQPPDGFRLLGNSPKFWTRSGRQALRLLLTALQLEPGSGVALPLFTDPSLVEAIIAAGHRPVFIDVDEQSVTMDPRSLDRASGKFSAVVVVHLFGQLADVPALLAAGGNVPVIEDTAHAPLSYLNGRMAGEFGLASFYSFASTKYWPAGGGGLAVVHRPELAWSMARQVRDLPTPSRPLELRTLVLQAAKSATFSRHVYGFLGRPMRRWADQWALLEPRLEMKAILRSHAAVANRQALRFAQRVEEQRTNSLRLLSHLAGVEDVVLPRERPGARYNYHLFPVLLRDPSERAAIIAGMWKHFVDTSTIYSGVVEACAGLGYSGGCPVAESVAGRLITLPNYAGLSNSEIDAVAQVFLTTLHAWRAARPSHPVMSFGVRRPAPVAGPAPSTLPCGDTVEP
jgi:dTDP-4-amino-4,6-dideoxygalactose transaminase